MKTGREEIELYTKEELIEKLRDIKSITTIENCNL